MSLTDDTQRHIQTRLDFSVELTGEAREARRGETESSGATRGAERPARTDRLMEEVCGRDNLKEALRRVQANKGSTGVDRMTVDDLTRHLAEHWPAIRAHLLNGTYEPKPVRRVEIPKPDGRFVRYADDCNIYVRTERAGHRVMDRVTRFLTTRLKLTVNASKSAVARPQERTFLGFTFITGPTVARAIAPKAVRRFKTKVREITRRAKGVSVETTIADLAPYMRGWGNSFGFCETPEALGYLTR
jgi:hypothetical protein